MVCAVHNVAVLVLASAVWKKKRKTGADINNPRLKLLDIFSFLLIPRELLRGWSPEATGESKVGHCRFIEVTPADVTRAGFYSLTIELTVQPHILRFGPFPTIGKLVSELEEDLAGCDPTAFGKCIKVFLFFWRGDAFRTPLSVGMDSSCRHEWSSGRPADFEIYWELQHDAITFFFSCLCFAVILKHFIFCV